jgi:hypothetical protein
MSNSRPDILITDRDDNPVAAVEVKNRENLTPDIAAILRRNLIVHGYAPRTPYFLFMSQNVGYLWKNADSRDTDAAPDYQFPMQNVIARYLHGEPKRRLSEPELELVISYWLIELTLGLREPRMEPQSTLAKSGFDEAIRGGRVVVEAAA